MAFLPYPRSHQTISPQNPQKFLTQDILPQNPRNTQKRLAEKKNLCTSVKSVGGSSTPEVSVCSVNSVGEPYAAKPSVCICEHL